MTREKLLGDVKKAAGLIGFGRSKLADLKRHNSIAAVPLSKRKFWILAGGWVEVHDKGSILADEIWIYVPKVGEWKLLMLFQNAENIEMVGWFEGKGLMPFEPVDYSDIHPNLSYVENVHLSHIFTDGQFSISAVQYDWDTEDPYDSGNRHAAIDLNAKRATLDPIADRSETEVEISLGVNVHDHFGGALTDFVNQADVAYVADQYKFTNVADEARLYGRLKGERYWTERYKFPAIASKSIGGFGISSPFDTVWWP